MSIDMQSGEKVSTADLEHDQAAYRAWLGSLSVGDQLEIAYSRSPSDAPVVKVIGHDGAWITLMTGWSPEEGPDIVRACAFNGTVYAGRLWPVGTTARERALSVTGEAVTPS